MWQLEEWFPKSSSDFGSLCHYLEEVEPGTAGGVLMVLQQSSVLQVPRAFLAYLEGFTLLLAAAPSAERPEAPNHSVFLSERTSSFCSDPKGRHSFGGSDQEKGHPSSFLHLLFMYWTFKRKKIGEPGESWLLLQWESLIVFRALILQTFALVSEMKFLLIKCCYVNDDKTIYLCIIGFIVSAGSELLSQHYSHIGLGHCASRVLGGWCNN